MDSNNQFIESVKQNDRHALTVFYNTQKQSFMSWAKNRFGSDTDTIVDVYQDAVVTLYHNILQGKIVEFTHTPEAYLFGIAKNLMYKRSAKDKRTVLVEDISEEINDNLDYEIYNRIDNEHRQSELAAALGKLQENCSKLLTLFYYQKYSTEAIMHRLQYSSVNVVKSRKNQCMKQLKKIMSTVNL